MVAGNEGSAWMNEWMSKLPRPSSDKVPANEIQREIIKIIYKNIKTQYILINIVERGVFINCVILLLFSSSTRLVLDEFHSMEVQG